MAKRKHQLRLLGENPPGTLALFPSGEYENCSYIFSPDLLEAARDLYLAGKQLLKERSNKVYESNGEFQQRWAIAWEHLQRAVAKAEQA